MLVPESTAQVRERPAQEHVELGMVAEPGQSRALARVRREEAERRESGSGTEVVQTDAQHHRIGRQRESELPEVSELRLGVVAGGRDVQHLRRGPALRIQLVLEENR